MAAQNLYLLGNTMYIKFLDKYHGFTSNDALGAICGNPERRTVDKIPEDERGFNITTGALLVNTNGGVYLVNEGTSYHIGNPATVAYYQLNGPQQSLNGPGQQIFNMLPKGSTIYAPGTKPKKKKDQ